MIDYQTLTLKETHEEVIVSTMEYPLMLAGVFYIKFIVYEKLYDYNNKSKEIYNSIKFITLQPQDILKRENIWSQEEEDIIKSAAQEAKEREKTMAEYQKLAEDEIEKRVQEIQPIQNQTPINDDNDIIDSEFSTEISISDPNYG
jgi:hypothetical protein